MFRGIPFAEPPVGPLRLATPQPYAAGTVCARRSHSARHPRSPACSERSRTPAATTG
ncbi:carboxylesterase family protein [Catellatospora sp. TT07R-123]|uniref:carboxylesterase family protein n=1 Tax=Catellatospora sp. TT07R-123 TaxID=2733863 RepID=UPI001BB2F1D2|nr:carboxylesterase family protein [Catellatospora sp. TT07R-123]